MHAPGSHLLGVRVLGHPLNVARCFLPWIRYQSNNNLTWVAAAQTRLVRWCKQNGSRHRFRRSDLRAYQYKYRANVLPSVLQVHYHALRYAVSRYASDDHAQYVDSYHNATLSRGCSDKTHR